MHFQSFMHPVMFFVVTTCRVQYEMHVLDILFLAYVLDIYCLTLWYCWYLTVCIKWVNMEFADTKLKFQPINFVYSPCQMYHTNSMHSTTMVDLCLCSVVAVSSIGRLLEIRPYSWKPLRFSLFGKWVQVVLLVEIGGWGPYLLRKVYSHWITYMSVTWRRKTILPAWNLQDSSLKDAVSSQRSIWNVGWRETWWQSKTCQSLDSEIWTKWKPLLTKSAD